MEYVIGIDLGTTNTCVALVEGGAPRVLRDKGGFNTTPSVVAIAESGRRLVGHLAKRQAHSNPTQTITGAKRLIGRKWDAPATQAARAVLPYELVEGPHGGVRIQVGAQILSIPEIAAFILREIRLIAEQQIGAPVERAVITVPAQFNDNQRQATKDAGRIAGLEVLRIINEPTAAALAYGFGQHLRRRVAVYDLGGGTFDVSILDIADGVFEVLGSGGDSFLGGQDLDERIAEYLLGEFAEDHDGLDISGDRMAMQRIRDAAEKARCELSTAENVQIELPYLHTAPSGNHYDFACALSREHLETLTEDLISRTIKICEDVLEENGLSKGSIDDVVLVGGTTRMPLVQRRVAESFGREPCQGVSPDEVVALGAALQAAALVDGEQKTLLLDVTPYSLGIMIPGGLTHRLIEKNTTVPTKASHVFTTTRDNQSTVKLVVLQGESDQAAANELLGEFLLSGLRRAPRGRVEVEVTFAISVDGLVSVSAKDLETGVEQRITVTANSGLGAEELERLIKESREQMIEVRSSEELIRQRRQVERLATDVRALLGRAQEVMTATRFGREAIDKIDATLLRAAREAKSSDAQALVDVAGALDRAQTMLRGVAERRSRPR
jgi:molecular chaperone DnaK